MERVLRKVNVEERLPEKIKRYFCITKSSSLVILEFDLPTSNWFTNQGNIVTIPEYWYEEVSVDELEDYKVAVGNLEMINEMDVLKAKERYRKALKYVEDNGQIQQVTVDSEVVSLFYGQAIKALKIATGLNEEEI